MRLIAPHKEARQVRGASLAAHVHPYGHRDATPLPDDQLHLMFGQPCDTPA